MNDRIKKIISVIVPVYNVESYLERCILSIVNQHYEHLEIILVDDGSKDGCPIICDKWADKDKRIKVIHKKNGGLSDARNVGIEAATGDYLLFVDSDDYIELTMCDRLLTAIENTEADIAVCNLFWDYPKHKKVDKLQQMDGDVVPKTRILEEYFLRSSVAMVVAWNKLYRRKLFFTTENIRYPVGRLHEDEFTSYRLLYTADKTVFIDAPLYHYVQRDNSIMTKYGERNFHDMFICIEGYLRWADRYAPEKRILMEYAAVSVCCRMINHCETMPNLKNIQRQVTSKGRGIIKQVHKFIHNPYAGWRNKVNYYALYLGIYHLIHRLYNLLQGRCK